MLARYPCAVSLTLTVLGLFLLAVSRSTVGVPVYDYRLENTVIAIGFSTVGAIIIPPSSSEPYRLDWRDQKNANGAQGSGRQTITKR